MDQQQLDAAWFQFQDIPGVVFKFNDAVRITYGKHQGMVACVIALLKQYPEPIYRIELGATGVDLELPEAALIANKVQ